jgi:hypothetical protein
MATAGKATAKQAQVLVAVEDFVYDRDGQQVRATAGVTRVRADHPAVKGREHLFAPDVPDVED